MTMPRMLANLSDRLDDIERANEWEATFVGDLLERFEADPDYALSDKQFQTLHRIHQKYEEVTP